MLLPDMVLPPRTPSAMNSAAVQQMTEAPSSAAGWGAQPMATICTASSRVQSPAASLASCTASSRLGCGLGLGLGLGSGLALGLGLKLGSGVGVGVR